MIATANARSNGQVATAIADPTNDGEATITAAVPIIVDVTIQGTADLLFHRWSCDAIEAKSKAAKGSAAKKTDDIESYVYRCDDESIGIPGEYVRGAFIQAGRYRQDPRSSRSKMAIDLFKAAVVSLSPLASTGCVTWDYLDRRRVVVNRSGVTRVRPALRTGWKASFRFLLLTPEYVPPTEFLSALNDAGRLVGVGDFRPTFGRFQVTTFSEVK